MNGILLSEAVRAPLQTGEETCYDGRTRAFLAKEELFYYRKSSVYRDWIEIFTHRGDSLGTFRTLADFLRPTCGAVNRSKGSAESVMARALLREIRPLIGHRIISVQAHEEEDCSMPFSVLILDDGRQLILQSDPEGNDGGFPCVVKPTPPDTSPPNRNPSHD